MSVFKHPNGYYGYNFMYKGMRFCKSFKGLSEEEVAELEHVHRANLIKRGYDIQKKVLHTLNDLIDNFKKYEKAHYTRVGEYDKAINKFLKLTGNKFAEDVTGQDVDRYINFRKKYVKNATIKRELNVICRMFTLAVENRWLKEVPFKVPKLRIDNPPERILTEDEEKKLLAACHPNLKAMVVTMLCTGMRKNELLNLKWEDVFFTENFLLGRDTKNNKIHKYLLMENLKIELQKLPRLSEYVFTCPITMTKYKDIKSSFARAVKRAGIPHINIHKLRHTVASRLLKAKVNIVTIKDLLDHKSIETTMRYAHSDKVDLVQAFRILDSTIQA